MKVDVDGNADVGRRIIYIGESDIICSYAAWPKDGLPVVGICFASAVRLVRNSRITLNPVLMRDGNKG